MSVRAEKWAIGLRGLTGPEKAVLVCLAFHHNGPTGLCCPGVQLIADEMCLGLSTVKKALASLTAKGLIARMAHGKVPAWALAIVEPEKPQESRSESPTETPYKEQESKHEKNGRSRANSDSGFWKKWQTPPAPPLTPASAVFIEEGSAEWAALLAASSGKRIATTQDRATGRVGRWVRPEELKGASL
jgi:hypothetical protein